MRGTLTKHDTKRSTQKVKRSALNNHYGSTGAFPFGLSITWDTRSNMECTGRNLLNAAASPGEVLLGHGARELRAIQAEEKTSMTATEDGNGELRLGPKVGEPQNGSGTDGKWDRGNFHVRSFQGSESF